MNTYRVFVVHKNCLPGKVVFSGTKEKAEAVYRSMITLFYSAMPSNVAEFVRVELQAPQQTHLTYLSYSQGCDPAILPGENHLQ